MGTRLRYLPLSEVSEGMVLGAPLVVTENGVTTFTLPVGQALTESNIEQIQRRHAEFVCVQVPDERTPEERAAELERLNDRLEKIFAGKENEEPALKGLFRAVMNYRSL